MKSRMPMHRTVKGKARMCIMVVVERNRLCEKNRMDSRHEALEKRIGAPVSCNHCTTT